MARKARWSSRAATRSRRPPTPDSPQPEEDEVTEEVQDESNVQSPASHHRADDDNEEEDEEAAEEAQDEEMATAADGDDEPDEAGPDSEHGDDASHPSTPQPSRSRPRRGRPPRRGRGAPRQSGWSTPEAGGDEGSDAGTPARRGRGRGRGGNWRGGFRGRARGANRGPSHVTRVPIDKAGNMMDVIDDEVSLPEDPEGETKVDKDGNLLGGREYRVRTFPIAGRGNRLYMLSTEPARCTGFRDSYLFFNKHLALFKIIIDEYEKRDLIDREVIPHSYKGRAIGVVTARSVFREFGAKIIVGGKKVTDDYHAQRARDRGDVEGELVDPYDKIPEAGEDYNRNQYVAWHGASSVYHTQGPNMPLQGQKPLLSGKRKANITSANWMYEHAMAASRFNSALNVVRKATFDGVYDTHTNMLCYPEIMQPTHARWELVSSPPASPSAKKRQLAMTNGTTSRYPAMANGTSHHHGGLHEQSPSHTSFKATMSANDPSPFAQRFPPPSRYMKNNYLITDIHLSTPSSPLFTLSNVPPSLAVHRPPSSPDFSAGRPAHLGIPTLSEAEMEDVDLPEDCRQALRDARRGMAEWAGQWKGTEAQDGARGTLKLGVGLPRDI